MLVLRRKQLRSVAIGGPNGCHLMLNVTVLAVQGGSLRLGLEVDTEPPGHRCEVRELSRAGGPSEGAAAPVAQGPLQSGP
jgi:sRNA-binding carbon storage regulator CsrA